MSENKNSMFVYKHKCIKRAYETDIINLYCKMNKYENKIEIFTLLMIRLKI